MARYLANRNTLEIHDLRYEQINCQIGEIKPKHRIPLNMITEVRYYIKQKGYNDCKWCLEEYHTD